MSEKDPDPRSIPEDIYVPLKQLIVVTDVEPTDSPDVVYFRQKLLDAIERSRPTPKRSDPQ